MFFCSCFDSSQALETVRWGLFRGLKCAPEKEAERAGRGAAARRSRFAAGRLPGIGRVAVGADALVKQGLHAALAADAGAEQGGAAGRAPGSGAAAARAGGSGSVVTAARANSGARFSRARDCAGALVRFCS